MHANNFFSLLEKTMLAKFNEANILNHNGDKGENREDFLVDFLKKHLPLRYGVVKGEVINKDGLRSHAIDIIIYDAINCPILYAEKTSVVPIEGVYGIIEVKSSLSKAEFIDASSKIERFKKLAPRDLGLIETREYVTLHRSSRPFGIVFGYRLSGNSLDSLKANWLEQCTLVHDVNFFCNLICVLGSGVLRYEHVNLTKGDKTLLLDTDEFVKLVLTAHKRDRNLEEQDETMLRIIKEGINDNAFGRFFTYLLIMLNRMKLNTPDLSRYIDPDLPMTITRE